MGAMADGPGAELRTALTRVRRRWLAARWLHALARVAVGACIGLLLVIAVELLLAPPDVPLLVVAGAAFLATLAFGARVLWPLRRPPADDRVARFVEERCPQLEDRVVSAAALAPGPATGFRELVLAEAAERLRGIDPARVVAPARLRRAAVRGILALAVFAAVVVLGSTPLSRIAATAWLHALPFGVELAIDPGDFRLVAGQPFRVRARFNGGNGVGGRTPPILSVLDGMTPRDVRMRPAGDGWLAEFPSVTRSFRYRVGAAAYTTRDYFVEALSPPRVTRIDVEYAYPGFTGLAPRVEEDGGDLFAPVGTAVRLVVHTDRPVAEGALVLSDGRRVALDDAGDGRRTATLVVEENGRYAVRVVDAHGWSNRDSADYLIRATTDRPPAVRVVRPGGDREVTPLEEVTIEVRADDDHAVDRLDLVYTVAGRADRALPFDVPERAATVTGVRTFFVEDLAVEPGDVITYFARVRDAGRAGVSTEARSDLYFLEVRPFDNAFEEALSEGGLGPEAAEIGRLVALQKQIIVATWRLGQPPGGHRADDVRAVAEVQAAAAPASTAESGWADDVRAVAEVQVDVRDAAAGAAGPMSVQSRRGAAGDPGPEAQRRAMAAAVEAMTAAEAALSALDTVSAMPHETEALNQLLTAQAAVRRRQVSMQPGRGSGGRQAQLDLSALFDRELRREQETSYETGRPPGAEETGEDDEALDRLRELARRQERINRDLRQASESGTDEERRRRLERLRRQQQALRAELEALAEQFGRPSGAEGRSGSAGRPGGDGQPGAEGRSGSGRTARGELRRAAEQMQRAADGLRRRDRDAAGEHGDGAVDALLRLAERLRGAGAGERAGALGDLQLEAQQIAQAQRRLAGEMEPAADGARSPGYRGLMAGEKDDLADRTEALEQGLSALAAGADAPDGAPAAGDSAPDPSIAEAHRTLVREEVAERMRAGAERLRAAGGRSADRRSSGGSASTGGLRAEETALADVLGTVAGLLHRAMMQDEAQRRLVADLETARRLRERLQGGPPAGGASASARGGPSGAAPSGVPSGAAPSGAPSGDVPSGGRSASASRSRPETGAARDGSGAAEGSPERGADASETPGRGGAGQASASGREAALELARHPALRRALAEADPGLAAALEGWVRRWRSPSAPGTDPARLDFAHWISLRRDLVTALQRFERDRSRALADRALRGRYAAGADEAVPERYRRLVEQYYRSLAGAPRAVR